MIEKPFKFVFWAQPTSYDTYRSDALENMPVARNIYAPLVSTFFDGKAQGMVAEKWETSKDGKKWRFVIRKGLSFSDGTAITPEIVLKNFRRILWLTRHSGLALNTALPEIKKWRDYSAPLKTIYAEGDSVFFKFSYQPVGLFEALEKPVYGIAHPKCFDEHGEWIKGDCLYESGQYRVVERLPDRMILQNRHVYPEAESAPEVVEYITSLPEKKTRLDWALETRAQMSILGTLMVGEDESNKILKSGYRVLPEPPLRMHYLLLNHNRPPFSDKNLRQSIRDTFLSLLSKDPDYTSEITLDHSFVPPGGMGYIKIPTPGLPAKRPQLRGVAVNVLLSPGIPPDNPKSKLDKFLKALETAILKTLEMHGIKANVSRDYSKARERMESGYFDLMFKYSGLSVQEPYEALRMMFASDIGARVPDPSGKVPKLIVAGQAAKEPRIRKKYAEEINRLIFDEAAVVTFTHSGFFYLHSSEIDISRMSTFSDPIEFRAISVLNRP